MRNQIKGQIKALFTGTRKKKRMPIDMMTTITKSGLIAAMSESAKLSNRTLDIPATSASIQTHIGEFSDLKGLGRISARDVKIVCKTCDIMTRYAQFR